MLRLFPSERRSLRKHQRREASGHGTIDHRAVTPRCLYSASTPPSMDGWMNGGLDGGMDGCAVTSSCFLSASTPDAPNTGDSYGTIWELIYYLHSTVGSSHLSNVLKLLYSSLSPRCVIFINKALPAAVSGTDYFTQQRQVLSLSVAAFGSSGKWWQDKLNIVVGWISRSINRAVLREKPENMFQRLDCDRWLSSAWTVSRGSRRSRSSLCKV